jgi:hypothetical protein
MREQGFQAGISRNQEQKPGGYQSDRFQNWDQWLLTKANTHQTPVTTSESKNPLVSVLSKTSKNRWFSSLKNWPFYRQQ